jgi:hypothetical protein
MSIEFEAVLEPRTEDGGFGHNECLKCGAKTTCYLRLVLFRTSSILICKGCLDEGIDTINDAMIESYKKEKLL